VISALLSKRSFFGLLIFVAFLFSLSVQKAEAACTFESAPVGVDFTVTLGTDCVSQSRTGGTYYSRYITVTAPASFGYIGMIANGNDPYVYLYGGRSANPADIGTENDNCSSNSWEQCQAGQDADDSALTNLQVSRDPGGYGNLVTYEITTANPGVTGTFTVRVLSADQYSLTSTPSPSTSAGNTSGGGLNCGYGGAICSVNRTGYITTSATAAPGYLFKFWQTSGSASSFNGSATNPIAFDIISNTSVNPVYYPILTLSKAGSNASNASITSSGGGITCSSGSASCSDGTADYSSGTSITLTATVGSGTIAWSGVTCTQGTQTGSTCSFTMSGPLTVTATFATAGDTQSPTFPSPGITATGITSSQITINWTSANDNVGISSYSLFRCTGSSCTPTTAVATGISPSSTNWTNTGLTQNTVYGYLVRAYDAAGNPPATTYTIYPTTLSSDTQPPVMSSSLSASAVSPSQINLTWSPATDNVGVTSYRVYRCSGVGCTPNSSVASGITGTSYSNTGLTANTSYSYYVTAFDAAGNQSNPPSNTASATTLASTYTLSVSVSPDQKGYVSANVGGLSCTSSTPCTTSVAGGTTGVAVSAIDFDPGYTFSSWTASGVAASCNGSTNPNCTFNMTGAATLTANYGLVTDTTPPSAPTTISATVNSSSQITVSWGASASSDVAQYNIYRCSGTSCSPVTVVNTVGSATLNWANSGLSAGTVYGYRVTAVDGSGNQSGYSSTAYATTVSCGGGNSFSELFAASTLDCAWTWIQGATGATYSLTNSPGTLQISTVLGNASVCYATGLNCSRITRAISPSTGMTYETKINGNAISGTAQAYGILLSQDNSNWIRFESWANGAPALFKAYKTVGGVTSAAIDSSVSASTLPLYIRVVQSGSNFTMQNSTDSQTWNTVGAFTQAGITPSQFALAVNTGGATSPATTAYFDYASASPTYPINFTKSGTYSSSVSVIDMSGPLACGTSCSAISSAYTPNSSVTLTISPSSGYNTVWTGCDSSTNSSCTVLVSNVKNISAVINTAVQTYNVSIYNNVGSGTGTISGNGMNCSVPASPGSVSGTCTVALPSGSYNFTATETGSGVFTSWSGCSSVSGNVCTVNVVSSPVQVQPRFDSAYAVNFSKSGSAASSITVQSSPAGINCGGLCTSASYSYNQGQTVTLSATPTAGYTTVWTGCDSSTVTTCTINSISANKTVTAVFTTATESTGLVANWTFDEASGSTAIDATGNNNNATLFNTPTRINGKYGYGALSFDGLNDYATALNSSSLNLSGSEATFMFWVYPRNTFSSDTVLFGKLWSSIWGPPYYQYGVELTAGVTPVLYVGTATGASSASMGSALTLDTWHHLTLVMTGGTYTWYRNGNAVAGGSGSLSPISARTSDVRIGSDGASAQLHKGYLDDVRIYSRALTAQEISGIYTSQSQTYTVTIGPNAGPGNGTVTNNINTNVCTVGAGSSGTSGVCVTTLNNGNQIVLTPNQNLGSQFTGWTVTGSTNYSCAGTGTCTINVTGANVNVIANFALPTFGLNVSTGAGGGVVASGQSGINCGADCSENYQSGTVISLTATPSSGYRFVGWTGDCSGTSICYLTINGAKNVTATFNPVAGLQIPEFTSATVSCSDNNNQPDPVDPTFKFIKLEWGAVSGAVGYNVYGKTLTGSSYVKIVSATTATTAFVYDTYNSTEPLYYDYVVTAIDSSNRETGYSTGHASIGSTQACFQASIVYPVPMTCPLSSDVLLISNVQGVCSTDASFTGYRHMSNTLTWNSVPGANNYNIYAQVEGINPFVIVGTVTGNSFTHSFITSSGLINNKCSLPDPQNSYCDKNSTLKYVVVAYDSNGNPIATSLNAAVMSNTTDPNKTLSPDCAPAGQLNQFLQCSNPPPATPIVTINECASTLQKIGFSWSTPTITSQFYGYRINLKNVETGGVNQGELPSSSLSVSYTGVYGDNKEYEFWVEYIYGSPGSFTYIPSKSVNLTTKNCSVNNACSANNIVLDFADPLNVSTEVDSLPYSIYGLKTGDTATLRYSGQCCQNTNLPGLPGSASSIPASSWANSKTIQLSPKLEETVTLGSPYSDVTQNFSLMCPDNDGAGSLVADTDTASAEVAAKLSGSCYANKDEVLPLESVTWTANLSGGIPPFTANYSGGEGLSGTRSSTQAGSTYVTNLDRSYTFVGPHYAGAAITDSRSSIFGSPSAASSASYACKNASRTKLGIYVKPDPVWNVAAFPYECGQEGTLVMWNPPWLNGAPYNSATNPVVAYRIYRWPDSSGNLASETYEKVYDSPDLETLLFEDKNLPAGWQNMDFDYCVAAVYVSINGFAYSESPWSCVTASFKNSYGVLPPRLLSAHACAASPSTCLQLNIATSTDKWATPSQYKIYNAVSDGFGGYATGTLISTLTAKPLPMSNQQGTLTPGQTYCRFVTSVSPSCGESGRSGVACADLPDGNDGSPWSLDKISCGKNLSTEEFNTAIDSIDKGDFGLIAINTTGTADPSSVKCRLTTDPSGTDRTTTSDWVRLAVPFQYSTDVTVVCEDAFRSSSLTASCNVIGGECLLSEGCLNCSFSPQDTKISPIVGQPMLFTAIIDGGTPPFDVLWSGDDISHQVSQSNSTQQQFVKVYSTAGDKNVSVVVVDSSDPPNIAECMLPNNVQPKLQLKPKGIYKEN
jgi:fibronectin type 3 domain-containing protein